MRTRKFLTSLIPALPMLLAALLVILVTVIFLTAMRSKAHAQFGGAEQPMFQMTSTASETPQSVPGLMHWWVAADVAGGAVTNWVDRISGSIFTNHSATYPSNMPVADVTGVYFARTNKQWLTNDGSGNVTSNNTVWIIFNAGANSGTRAIINQADNALSNIRVQSSAMTFNYGYPPSWVNVAAGFSAGVWYDVAIVTETNVSSTLYTNSLFKVNTTGTLGIMPDNTQFHRIGKYVNDVDYFLGYIREIAIYTNSLNQTHVDLLHKYATNTYLYTP